MRPESSNHGPRVATRHSVQLWFAVLGGAAAWFLHLCLTYALVPAICHTPVPELVLHGATVVLGATALTAGLLAFRLLRLFPVEVATTSRVRFMARAGLALDILFLLVIIAQGLPALFHDPCIHADGPLVLRQLLRGGLGSALAPLSALLLPAPAWAHVADSPHPGALRWNTSPEIVLPLLGLLLLYVRGARALARRGHAVSPGRTSCFAGAVAALVVALLSPLDEAGASSFSAHMAQHMVLMLVAAPLLALGASPAVLLWGLPRGVRIGAATLWRRHGRPIARLLTAPLLVWTLHALAVWAWHLPRLYEAALEDDWIHLLEHASFLGTAWLFWGACVRAGGRRGMGYGVAILFIFPTAVQAGALGALITFAPAPWYSLHAEGVPVVGLTPLQDQQLAGLIMWVPGGVVYVSAALMALFAWLRAADRALNRAAPAQVPLVLNPARTETRKR